MDNPDQKLNDHVGLPLVVDEDSLLKDLAFVVRTCGTERFFTNPILMPTKECFPDSWAPNSTGVRILAQRLMMYAGLGQITPQVEVYTDPAALRMRRSLQSGLHQGAAAYFVKIENNKAIFALESGNIDRPDSLIATMGHEVAHAFRTYHGVTVDDRQREEELTDITSIYLGFGVFACNSSRTYETSGSVQGLSAVTREFTQRLGYLPPRALAFLLACQVVARGYKVRETRRLRACLKSDHKHYFAEALHDIERSRSILLDELGVSEADADRMSATALVAPSLTPIIVEGISQQISDSHVAAEGPTCPSCGESIDYKVKFCPHCQIRISTGCSWYVLVMMITFFMVIAWPEAIIILLAEAAVYAWMKWPWRKTKVSQQRAARLHQVMRK